MLILQVHYLPLGLPIATEGVGAARVGFEIHAGEEILERVVAQVARDLAKAEEVLQAVLDQQARHDACRETHKANIVCCTG